MMYNNSLAVAVKNKGNVLREDGNKVFIPFGEEYSVLIKNLNTKKALVNVEIDGREAISGLIVDANSSTELERFFQGNLNKGNKFKFIEKTKEIEDFRGNKVDDGLIRVEFQFEKTINYDSIYKPYRYTEWPVPTYYGSSGTPHFNSLRSYNNTTNTSSTIQSSVNDKGITVEGRESNQSFIYGNIGWLEDEKHVIILQLIGGNKTPLYVKDKIQCKYCGVKWKSNVKYCGNCGSSLL